MARSYVSLSLALILCFGSDGYAQGPALDVGKIETPSLRWGHQFAQFSLTNSTEDVKHITMVAHIIFDKGTYLHPERTTVAHRMIEPGQIASIAMPLDIPGNFGGATLTITLYDVVDTLDAIMPSMKFFQQPFMLRFHIPDPLTPYMQERVSLPPCVEQNADFDNEFSRLLVLLINQGKDVSEIADMAAADSSFVQDVVDQFKIKTYVIESGGKLSFSFPIILSAEAEAGRLLANDVVGKLAPVITNNLTRYSHTLDSLVTAGMMSADTSSFTNGGAVLYRQYPTVGALALWMYLGQRFIEDSLPLEIFRQASPCNIYTPGYMYAVQGGALVGGSHYYNQRTLGSKLALTFGDRVPQVVCPDPARTPKSRPNRDWQYGPTDSTEMFLIDTAVGNVAAASMTAGAEAVTAPAREKLREITEKYAAGSFSPATRYWFWNMVATRTMAKLVEKKVITRRGNGMYRLEGTNKVLK